MGIIPNFALEITNSKVLTLIKSISGIRGTIGGKTGEGLTPIDVVKYTAAFGSWCLKESKIKKMVVGRDARISGEIVNQLVVQTLRSLGIDVIDLGLSTTPTVEMAVPMAKAGGGIIITASHNPKQWNALKLINADGEFINDLQGKKVLDIADKEDFEFAEVNDLGGYQFDNTFMESHIQAILDHPLVDVKAIAERDFKIVVDAVNSTGGIFVPELLKALGVTQIDKIFCTPDGNFPHNPEPLPENLTALSQEVLAKGADLGIAVDPDVDRLAFINEDGSAFGEEYTLVAVADYVLQHRKGNTVSNLSSTRALKDVTLKAGGEYNGAAVGEVNVVTLMKETNAVIGGEGNGGVIFPELHYGRDALIGIALFLTHLANFGKSISLLRSTYPSYHIAKNKLNLSPEMDIDTLLKKIQSKYKNQPINTIDGVKIEFDNDWVHLRKSNTEPIIRIYAESGSQTQSEALANKIIQDFKEFIQG